MKIPDLLKGKNDDSFLFNDRQRAIKNHRLMQWAKVATFGLYIVAVFMLYVSDVWGITSFVEKNSNEYIALAIFSTISFVLAYFLASSKEAVYEDIAIHRSEGWKLKPTQYAAMGLFLSSGLLFEMFSTTNNQQHIANTAAEQSSMMKSIQGTDVSVAGSVALTETLQKAQVRLASCQKLLEKGKVKDCVESQANLKAVQDSMLMSNQLAQTASQQAMTSKVDGMLKVREHFDKPMFQAIGKATDTDNNTGMLMVVGVLIFIFECQHIMALFAYANALRRLKQNGAAMPQAGLSPAPAQTSAPETPLAAFSEELRGMVGQAPEKIANEFNRAQHAREQLYQKAADKLDSIQADLNSKPELKQVEGFKQSPAQLAKVQELYNQQLRDNANGKTYRQELAEGQAIYSDSPLDKPRSALPKMSVEATVQQIQSDVRASGANTPEAIRASVFNSFATLQNPAPLDDAILQRIADRLVIKQAHAPAPARPANQKPGGTGLQNPALGTAEGHYPLPLPNAFPASESVSEKRAHTVGNASEKRVHTLSGEPENALSERARTVANTLSTASIYQDWLADVSSGTCKKTVRDTRTWVQKRLSASQANKLTPNPKEFAAITEMLFSRAIKDPVSGITLNPDFRSGGKKYL